MSQARPAPRLKLRHVEALRADLKAAGFTVEGVARRLGPMAAGAINRDGGVVVRRVLRGARDPQAVLVTLWSLGDPVPARDVATALPRTGLAGLAALGLISSRGELIRATFDLRPYAIASGPVTLDAWLCSDWGEPVTSGPLPPDHVLGVGGASMTLSSWTPRAAVGRALDLGTGCGVQALALAGHADHVVATDVDARTLAFAAFTAALAGQTWDLRRGDLFAPVAGEQFDLVVSNPPFVITPRHRAVPRYTYRDGGLAGDTVVATMVQQVAGHLAPGGVAQFLGNWEIGAGEVWSHGPAAWLHGTGLDAWVIQRERSDPSEYAHTWIRDGGQQPGTSAYNELTQAWLNDFEHRGVEAVGFGIITLRRPDQGDGIVRRAPYACFDEVRTPVAEPMGPAVAAGLAARVWLADHPGDDVLDYAWRCAPDVLEERYGRPGAVDPAVIRLTQGGGLRRAVQLDTIGAAVLSVCDGSMTAAAALNAVCALLGEDATQARPRLVALLRNLVADGMLVAATAERA